jgi:hypothetical protein
MVANLHFRSDKTRSSINIFAGLRKWSNYRIEDHQNNTKVMKRRPWLPLWEVTPFFECYAVGTVWTHDLPRPPLSHVASITTTPQSHVCPYPVFILLITTPRCELLLLRFKCIHKKVANYFHNFLRSKIFIWGVSTFEVIYKFWI